MCLRLCITCLAALLRQDLLAPGDPCFEWCRPLLSWQWGPCIDVRHQHPHVVLFHFFEEQQQQRPCCDISPLPPPLHAAPNQQQEIQASAFPPLLSPAKSACVDVW